MAIGSPGGGGAMSDINVTPLVDVMLVLLIIFMVAVPLIEKERQEKELEENRDRQQRLVELNLPQRDTTPTPSSPNATTQLRITQDLKVSLDDTSVVDCSSAATTADKRLWRPCLDQLESALLGSEKAKDGVVIDAEPRVPFGFVVASIHRIRKSGIEDVGMLPR